MRILLIAQYFPPKRSSFAARWAWLAAELTARGHQLDVVALLSSHRHLGKLHDMLNGVEARPNTTIRPVFPRVPHRTITGRSINEALEGVTALGHALRFPRPDVVVASAPALVVLPLGCVVATLKRRPLLLDLRDTWPELIDNWREWNLDGQQQAPMPLRRRTSFPLAAAVLRRTIVALRARADSIVVTSQKYADQLTADGLPRVHLVRNTSVKSWPEPLPPPLPQADHLNVLYLGNVGRAQLLATAIRAAALARSRGVPVTLRVVGTGPYWRAARAIADETDAPVEFHDRVPTTEVLPHYRWADTVLVILRDWDALRSAVPSKLYEAFLTGRHITASLAGEAATLVREFEAGDVVDPEDAEALAILWAELAADRSRLRVPTRARTWVRGTLSPERLGDDFEAALNEVVGG